MSVKKDMKSLVAFRIDDDIAAILDRLPNKSDFIRRAIVAQLGVDCPLCRGRGLVSSGANAYFGPIIDDQRRQTCAHCFIDIHLPIESSDLKIEDRLRLEQFYRGGPLYCEVCFRAAQPCGECEWRLDDEHLVDHQRFVHCSHT